MAESLPLFILSSLLTSVFVLCGWYGTPGDDLWIPKLFAYYFGTIDAILVGYILILKLKHDPRY